VPVVSSHFYSMYFSLTCSLFTCLLAQKVLFFLESSFLTLVSSSVCKGPLGNFFIVLLVVVNCFSFSLWKVLISPSIGKGSFVG
jgi:hypothetical protein